MTSILFRVDASPQIGLGHLRRCLSLGTALQQPQADIVFLTNNDTVAHDRVSTLGFKHHVTDQLMHGDEQDVTEAKAIAIQHGCDVVVVDSYEARADYLAALRDAQFYVVAIDDLAGYSFPCQLVVNGGAHARRLPYNSSSGDTRFLLGPEYALLSQEFWNIPPRKAREDVQNILIIMGGADAHNLTPRLLAALDELTADFTFTVIVGPFSQNRADVERAVNSCQKPARILDSPGSMLDALLESDLAISAGGQTLYELAATGTPTVAIEASGNQSDNIKALATKGVIVAAGRANDPQLIDQVTSGVEQLALRSRARNIMSEAGQRLVDGQGALRTANIISEHMAR